MAARFASRAAAFTAYFLVFCSAVINCGIFSYFLHAYKDRNVRLVYMQVIPTITMAFYLFLQFLPFLPKYRGWMMPVNLVFSYLWLTGFVFAAEEYSTLGCSWHSPFETGRCALKHAGEAFHFIGFFFLVVLVVLEAFVWGVEAHSTVESTQMKQHATV